MFLNLLILLGVFIGGVMFIGFWPTAVIMGVITFLAISAKEY